VAAQAAALLLLLLLQHMIHAVLQLLLHVTANYDCVPMTDVPVTVLLDRTFATGADRWKA
jgi:hypothetical protein